MKAAGMISDMAPLLAHSVSLTHSEIVANSLVQMRKSFFVAGAVALASLVIIPTVTTSASSTPSSSVAKVSASDSTTATNLACAEQIVSKWSVERLANETISVSVNGADIAALAPAARDGYGAILLFGTTAPADFAAVVAALQRETPDQYRCLS